MHDENHFPLSSFIDLKTLQTHLTLYVLIIFIKKISRYINIILRTIPLGVFMER